MDNIQILNKIKDNVKNPGHIHYLDEQKVACIFYDLFKQNTLADLNNMSTIVKELPSDYSEFTKDRIADIARIMAMLADCSGVI